MNTDELLALLYKYFPEGVEVLLMPSEHVMETVLKSEFIARSNDALKKVSPPEYDEQEITLTELFPGSGMFAAMSPLTHCIYCFTPGEA